MKPQGGTVSLFLDVALKLIQKRKGIGSRSRTRVDHQEDQEVTIAIEDEGEDGVGEVQKLRGGRVTRQGSRVQERERLCEFPPGESPCVTVTYKDYKTLEHDTWLNDIIIDFFLAWLYREVLEEEDRPRVHIFTTMFYRCRPLM